MSATPRVLTPTSVGRFVATIRSVATPPDGLVVCGDCRREMSDLATSCPHCGADAVATGEFTVVEPASGSSRRAASDVGRMSLVIVSLAFAVYLISKIAGL